MSHQKVFHVKKRNGRLEKLYIDKVNKCAERACEGLSGVSASEVVLDAHVQLYDKITTKEIDKALIMSARAKIEKEPNYSYVAARLLLGNIHKEVFDISVDKDAFDHQYRLSFVRNIKTLIEEKVLNEKLLSFDLKKLSQALVIDRDLKFKYLGLQIVYDRYLLHLGDRRLESPQSFWMRVAMGLALNEENKEEKAIEFYEAISQFRLCPSTPTLFNSGSTHSQLSSCYLNTFDDSIDGIFEGLWQEAKKSKFAGGLGFDVTPLRASNSHVKGTNGKSSGLIPWLKIYNDTLIAVDQGGKRPGAGCAYLEPWHLDLEDFLDLRKNTGDERRRCHDMNTANWIPDLFMRRVKEDGDWYLFSPSDVRDLHETFGETFDNLYKDYCGKADSGEIKNFRKIKAKELWKKMLRVLFETGHPWMTFKDNSNLRYSNAHEGTIHSSNLCLTGDSLVYAIIEKMPVKISLQELNDLFCYSSDIKVLSFNSGNGQAEYQKITASALTKKNANLIKITDAASGKSIRCTSDHKIFTVNRGYVEAKNLKPEDVLKII